MTTTTVWQIGIVTTYSKSDIRVWRDKGIYSDIDQATRIGRMLSLGDKDELVIFPMRLITG